MSRSVQEAPSVVGGTLTSPPLLAFPGKGGKLPPAPREGHVLIPSPEWPVWSVTLEKEPP